MHEYSFERGNSRRRVVIPTSAVARLHASLLPRSKRRNEGAASAYGDGAFALRMAVCRTRRSGPVRADTNRGAGVDATRALKPTQSANRHSASLDSLALPA
ncbi:hypothetical protein LC55x_2975 [Lysobacter capsici]|nr:hypothetical protein LC55x_2975 [Lysobacter capsici]